MKKLIFPAATAAAFILSTSTLGAEQNATQLTALSAQITQLEAQTQTLQHELNQLRAKLQKNKKHAKTKSHAKSVAAPVTPASSSFKPFDHFVTITTTPFLSDKTSYSGSDLLYNATSMNEDYTLLQQKKLLENELHKQHYDIDRPILQISGDLEGQMYSDGGFGTATDNGIALSNAEIDINAIASSWATGFMAIDYTNAPISSGNRSPQATLYLNRGFVTIGNLNQSPIYFSVGLMYPPFGRYMTTMLSTPLTKSMGRILSPTAELGFGLNNGLNGSIFAYSGSQTSGGSNLIEQEGANLGFKNTFGEHGSYTLGTAIVSNIADSQGMQNNGLSANTTQFAGFGVATATSTNNNALVHNVPGFNAHAKLGYGPVTLYSEYIGAMEQFSASDMTFNGVGAQPESIHNEMDYTLPFLPKRYGSTVGVAYDHGWQALALNLPENSYIGFFTMSIWRNTGESIEYRHDTDYSASDYASGRGATANTLGTGDGRNSVLAELDVYF